MRFRPASFVAVAMLFPLLTAALASAASPEYHLIFGIAMHDEGQFTPVGRTDGMTFVVELRDGEQVTELFRKDKEKTDRKIDYVAVDLSEYAGKAIKLRFIADPGPAGDPAYDWGVWVDPRVVEGKLPDAWPDAKDLTGDGTVKSVLNAIDEYNKSIGGVGDAEGLRAGAVFDTAAFPVGWDVNAMPWPIKICYGHKVRGIFHQPAWDGEAAASWGEYPVGLGVAVDAQEKVVAANPDTSKGDAKFKAAKADLKKAAELAAELNSLITQGREQGLQMRLPRVTAAILKTFVPRIEEDLDGILRWTGPNFPGWFDQGPPYGFANAPVAMTSKPELSKTFIAERRQRGQAMAAYLVKTAGIAIAEAKQILAHPEAEPKFPEYDMGNLTIRDGYFYSGDTPALLTGLYTNRDVKDDYAALSEIGICFTQPERLGLFTTVFEDNVDRPEFVDSFVVQDTLERAQQNNIGCLFDLGLQYLPGWATEKYPEMINPGSKTNHYGPYSVVSDTMRQLTARFVDVLVPRASKFPVTLGYEMANQTYMNPWSPKVIEMFRQWAQEHYGTIAKANSAWRSSFKSFEEIAPDLNMRKIEPRGLRYDWIRFQHTLTADWYRWLAGEIREHAPQTHVTVQPAGNLFEPQKFDGHDAARVGVDEVDLYQNITSVSTIDFCTWYWGRFVYEQAGQHCDLLRSIAPDKPIINVEYGLGTYNSISSWSPEYIRASLWYSYLHGMGGNTAWIWTVTELADETQTNTFARWPDRIEYYGRAALELRQHAGSIVKFGRQKAEVAVLYPAPTRWFDELKENQYYEQVRRFWHAISLLDAPYDFVTDEQIAAGKLDQYKLLLVPASHWVQDETFDAIRKFVRQGGDMVANEGSFSFDGYDKKRKLEPSWERARSVHDVIQGQSPARDGRGSVYCVNIASGHDYRVMLERVYDQSKIWRPVRVRMTDKSANTTIEARTAPLNGPAGEYLLYCFNLGQTNSSVTLDMPRNYKFQGNELISGQPAEASFKIKPLEIRMWKLQGPPQK